MTSEYDCFCELAPLYALDLLSAEEKYWVESQILASPDLAAELREYENAVAAIPYTVPAVPVSPDLKQKLFEHLNLATSDHRSAQHASAQAPSAPEPQPIASDFLAVRSQQLKWQPHTTPGVFIALLHRDMILRQVVGILRADPGVRYPLHRHADVEELYMLSGDLIIGDQIYGEGDYIRSAPGSMHAPYTETGCQFFFRTSMDDEYDLVLAET